MLRVSGLDSFYYLPKLHDMRYKGPRLSEIIRNTYHRDPLMVTSISMCLVTDEQ